MGEVPSLRYWNILDPDPKNTVPVYVPLDCVQDVTLLTQNAVVYPTEDGRLSAFPVPPSGQVSLMFEQCYGSA